MAEELLMKNDSICAVKPSKRPFCERCKRPKKVCLCEAFPVTPMSIKTTVYVLQHPEEQRRQLTTVPILAACIPKENCIVYNNVKYSEQKYSELHKMLKCQNTLVLYPDARAIDIRDVVKKDSPGQIYNLVVPDGTWRQARAIYKKNEILQNARKVQLNEKLKSHYVIRTQPTRSSLSTLEAIAVSLSILEGRDEIFEVLIKPLQLLCEIQIKFGAVPHSSKEEKKEEELLALKQKSDKDDDETRLVKKSKLDDS